MKLPMNERREDINPVIPMQKIISSGGLRHLSYIDLAHVGNISTSGI